MSPKKYTFDNGKLSTHLTISHIDLLFLVSIIATIHGFFIRKSSKKGPHLDMHKKGHHINLDKLIWAYLTCLSGLFNWKNVGQFD